MNTTHSSIDLHSFFVLLFYRMILTLGETRDSFPPKIAAVEAGSRAVPLSCCAQGGCHGGSSVPSSSVFLAFWGVWGISASSPEPALSFLSSRYLLLSRVSLRCMVFAASSGAGPPPFCKMSNSWLVPRGLLLGSPKVCLAAMETVGNLGFSFLFYGRLYRFDYLYHIEGLMKAYCNIL